FKGEVFAVFLTTTRLHDSRASATDRTGDHDVARLTALGDRRAGAAAGRFGGGHLRDERLFRGRQGLDRLELALVERGRRRGFGADPLALAFLRKRIAVHRPGKLPDLSAMHPSLPGQGAARLWDAHVAELFANGRGLGDGLD